MKTPSTHCTTVTARHAALLLLTGLAISLTGCASSNPKEKPTHQRGWVGGEYKRAQTPRVFGWDAIQAFPPQVAGQSSALLVTALSSNAPARLAGVREGDLILELNHEPVTRLKDFHRIVDNGEPGSTLPVKVYRNGETLDFSIVVGRETFRHQGNLMLGFKLSSLDLWPNPDFSLIVVSYYRGRDRAELGSVENLYRRSCYPKGFQTVDSEWSFWLVILGVSREKIILAQESVPAG